MNEIFFILIKNSQKFVLKGPIENDPALVYILASNRRQAIIWTNANPIYWRIYAALGGDELSHWLLRDVAAIWKCNLQAHFTDQVD